MYVKKTLADVKRLVCNAMMKSQKMSCSLVLVFVLIFFSSLSISQDCGLIRDDRSAAAETTNVSTCATQKNTNKVLKIAVLLPSEATEPELHNLVYHNRLESVQMALETIADVNNTHQTQYISPLKQVLPGWKIEIVTGDTECSATTGPLEAFRLHCQAGPCSFHYHTLSLSTIARVVN